MSQAPARRVVVLDRDGTLVIDKGYLGDPSGLEFTSGAPEALRLLTSHNFQLIVATNQSGVGRGFYTLRAVHAMNLRLTEMVVSVGARLAGLYFCTHRPDDGCPCRKPRPGMMHQAAHDLAFDPACAVVVGDKASDVEFGNSVGAETVYLSCVVAIPPLVTPTTVVSNLREAAQWIVERSTSPGHAV